MPRLETVSEFMLLSVLCTVAALSSTCAASELVPEDAVNNAVLYESSADDTAVEQVQFRGFQSPFFNRPTLATTTPQRSSRSADRRLQSRQLFAQAPATPRRRRLSRTPDMLGDSFQPPFLLTLQPQGPGGTFVKSHLSLAAGSARAKVSEHNKALPHDRIYFNYNHFQNAVQRTAFIDGVTQIVGQTANVDRFTLGGERTLFNGDMSIAMQLPLTSFPDADVTLPGLGPAGRFKSDMGIAGNLSVVGKQLLVNSEDLLVSCGLGIELPTGADASVLSETNLFSVENESLFLQPFVALTLDNGDAFVHSFLQLDVDVGASPLTITDLTGAAATIAAGEITQPTLVHWDTTTGIWLARSEEARGITGIAAIAEFHLSSAVSSPEQLSGDVSTLTGPSDFVLAPGSSRYTVSYVTAGIHAEIGQNQSLRVAGVFPLHNGVQQFFDSEVLVQFGRRY